LMLKHFPSNTRNFLFVSSIVHGKSSCETFFPSSKEATTKV
jgi:hypothetical protein